MRLNHLTNVELIRYHRLAYKTLIRFQSRRAFNRLALVVAELDRREYV